MHYPITLNSINPNIFPRYGGKFLFRENATNIMDIKPWAFDRNRGGVTPCVQSQRTVMSFFVFPHAKPELRHQEFHKFTGKLENLILKNILCSLCVEVGRFQEKPVFCSNVCSSDTH